MEYVHTSESMQHTHKHTQPVYCTAFTPGAKLCFIIQYTETLSYMNYTLQQWIADERIENPYRIIQRLQFHID